MDTQRELARRFREVLLDGKWIANTNFKKELTATDWQMANRKLGHLNTIAALAQHIHYYVHGVKNAFIDGKLEISDSLSFTFPEIRSQDEWELFMTRFWNDATEFAELIEQLGDATLDSIFIKEEYGSYLLNIESMIEHCYYHLGQIVLIKKMLKNKQETTW